MLSHHSKKIVWLWHYKGWVKDVMKGWFMHWHWDSLVVTQYKMGMGFKFKQNKMSDCGISSSRGLGFSQIWAGKRTRTLLHKPLLRMHWNWHNFKFRPELKLIMLTVYGHFCIIYCNLWKRSQQEHNLSNNYKKY